MSKIPADVIPKLLKLLKPPPGVRVPKTPEEIGWFIEGAEYAWDDWGPDQYDHWLKAHGYVDTRDPNTGRRIKAKPMLEWHGFWIQGAAAAMKYRKRW